MWMRVRPPLAVVAAALLGLILLLAVLQYQWLGQISEAERAQRRATLAAGAVEFAQDFDREITRAYLLFQTDLPFGSRVGEEELAERFAARYDRWQATARFPRLLKEFYAFSQDDAGAGARESREPGAAQLHRFDPATRRLEPVEWPQTMQNWRDHLSVASWKDSSQPASGFFIRRMPSAIWEDAPAIVVPAPVIMFGAPKPEAHMVASMSYSLLMIDRDYVGRELLPALAERHFGGRGTSGAAGETSSPGAGLDFEVAVLSRSTPGAYLFQSTPRFAPALDAESDATADLFQVRTQDFLSIAAEVRRFTAFATQTGGAAPGGTARFTFSEMAESRPLSIVIQPGPGRGDGHAGERGGATTTRTETRMTASSAPLWKLVVTHPSGSLEAAVSSQRRRNLAISSSVLGLLGASMGLLVLATRRAQRLAKQQLEFVAAVSHELRTPLAVIRSAAENLADGVVHDEARIRRYGELMRTEGRRLTDMVEQILEFAGIQSGQRGFALRPVGVGPLLHDIVSASSGLIEGAGLAVEFDIPGDLPPALGDEAALRRAFQNLIDNAIKYGAAGGSIRLSARRSGSTIDVTVADRGIGIDPADHARIFEPFYRAPDVVAAQMQGAGLGLSLVQRIVAAHGGKVTVKSAPREGSAFTVQLPVADQSAQREAAVPSRTDTRSSADPASGVSAVRSS
jgi:signal transduction histidine kinase